MKLIEVMPCCGNFNNEINWNHYGTKVITTWCWYSNAINFPI